MTAQVITKYKTMFQEMTQENQEHSEDYEVIDLTTLDIEGLKDLKTIYQGYGFLGDAIDMNWIDKCEALYGETWKAQLSKMAGLNPRTVRRWASGEIAIRQIHLDKINKTYDIWREE
jgi:hypothetical protein